MDLFYWARDFGITLLLELPVYGLALRGHFGAKRALAIALLLNVCTHPIAWSAIVSAARPWPVRFTIVECAVWIVEAGLVGALGRSRLARRRLRASDALIVALAANALSAGVGLLGP